MKQELKSSVAIAHPLLDRRWLRAILFACVALLAVTFVFASGMLDDKYNTYSIQQAEKEFKVSLEKETAADAPLLKVIGPRKVPSGDTAIEVVVVNPLKVPIAYSGYRMDAWTDRPAAGEISPLYGGEIKTAADGKWQPASLGWCGNGADKMLVRPGHAARFYVRPEENAVSQRVIVGYTFKDKNGDEKEEKLSAEFKPVEGERKAE